MAARRRRRRRSSARRSPAPRRRRRRSGTRRVHTTRRRRTRRNPSFNIKGTLIGALGGALLGAGAYALAGQNLSPPVRMAIAAGVGIVGGVAVSAINPSAGAGVAGGGVAVATLQGLAHYMTQSETTKGLARARQLRAVRANVGGGQVIQLNGPQARRQLGAVIAPIAHDQYAMMNGLYPNG